MHKRLYDAGMEAATSCVEVFGLLRQVGSYLKIFI
jgi:hypothetical protein